MGQGKAWPEMTHEELRQRVAAGQALLMAKGKIYDATEYIVDHPGGPQSIVRRCDGKTDCARDFGFHSTYAQEKWKACQVAILVDKRSSPDAPKLPPFDDKAKSRSPLLTFAQPPAVEKEKLT